ncbi:MAG: tetratricopeptide repeat protein [Bacteroidetes bacterium]|nr:tetratricopeptide repeat protein [Bacteroidota bacterium]
MKKYLFLAAAAISAVSCTQVSLSEDAVREFTVSHLENQVGYEAAVEGYYAGISEELMYWANPVWKNTPKVFEKPEKNDGSFFYEDSITVELHDVYLMGDHASVMGTMRFYIAGVTTGHRNFSGIVTEEEGQLKWTRFVSVDHNQLSKGFVWPSTELEGIGPAYREMRRSMLNLQSARAKELSDSLVALDPQWASAHLGQLHYYWMQQDVDGFTSAQEAALSKLEGASRAEEHLIRAFTTDRAVANKHLEAALLYAPADPMLRVLYAYGQEDPNRAIDLLQLAWDRSPENGGVNNMLGYKYIAVGDLEKAKQHFEIYLRTHPEYPNAYDSYGDYYLAAGDTAMAKEMFMSAYERDNNWTASKEKADEL